MADFPTSGAARVREPAFSIPAVVVALVVALLAVHAVVEWLGDGARVTAYLDWGFIPGRLTAALWPDQLDPLRARGNFDPEALQQARIFRDLLNEGAKPWTLATYAFLHGSWTHVGVNCIWLVAFGPPVARRFGAVRFILFFLVTAVAGALAHWALAPMDLAPLIGASAADSGLMAAAARFMFQPRAPLGAEDVSRETLSQSRTDAPAASLLEMLTQRRALVFIGFWLVSNFVFGAGAQTLGASEEPVAWVAHVGGFLAGLLLFPLFDRVGRVD